MSLSRHPPEVTKQPPADTERQPRPPIVERPQEKRFVVRRRQQTLPPADTERQLA